MLQGKNLWSLLWLKAPLSGQTACQKVGRCFSSLYLSKILIGWMLLSYLGLGADPIAGEGILPLWETQVGDEQAVVGCEGFGEEMPIQSSVQEPDLCVWGDH